MHWKGVKNYYLIICLLIFPVSILFYWNFSPWSSHLYENCAENNVLGGLSFEGFISKVFSQTLHDKSWHNNWQPCIFLLMDWPFSKLLFVDWFQNKKEKPFLYSEPHALYLLVWLSCSTVQDSFMTLGNPILLFF